MENLSVSYQILLKWGKNGRTMKKVMSVISIPDLIKITQEDSVHLLKTKTNVNLRAISISSQCTTAPWKAHLGILEN